MKQKLLIASDIKFEAKAQALIDDGWTPIGPVMCNNMPRFDYYQTFQKSEVKGGE